MNKKRGISVVICTRNRFNYLKRCLVSLLTQDYIPREIIIIDDGSEKDFSIRGFFKSIGSRFKAMRFKNIKVILIKNKSNSGVVASRNTGIKVATGELVAFLDDDGYAHKGWLKNLAENYNDKRVLGVGGPVLEIGRKIEIKNKENKKIAYIKNGKIVSNYRIRTIWEAHRLKKQFVPFLQGGNMSFRRDALLNINGGDINFTGNCYREETDLGLKISKKGKLLFEPAAIAYHDTAKKGGAET